MRVLFLQDKGINESFAVTDIASFLKQHGHKFELFIEKNEKNLLSSISNFQPELIVIPWDIGGSKWIRHIIKILKEKLESKVVIVFCGSYPTFYPDVIEKETFVDILCLGEAEYALLDLANSLEKGEDIKHIENLWVKEEGKIYKNPVRDLITDLDSLPLPDRDVYFKYKYLADMRMKRFTTGSGCPHSCTYCYNSSFKKLLKGKREYVRKKSVDRIIEEISVIKSKYILKQIHFSEDLFANSKEWVLNFCKRYEKEVNLPFTFNATVDEIDEEMLCSLKSANCSGISISVDSGSEKIRKKVLNEPYSDDEIIKTARCIKKHGIYLSTVNYIGIPDEKLDDVFKTLHLNIKISADNARIFFCTLIPRTPLADYAIEKGLLKKDYEFEIEDIKRIVIDTPFKRQLENLSYVFPVVVSHPFLMLPMKFIINLPVGFFLKIFLLFHALREKRFFNSSFFSSLKVLIFGGNPFYRTKIFNNFIP